MISPGTILMDGDTVHPACMELEEDSHPNAWRAVKHLLSSSELERELAATGWTFHLLAGQISTTAMGFQRGRMLDAALKRLIANAKRQKCNCLEIDEITTRSFLGVPYVSVSAHARHIQKGAIFSGRKA